MGTQTVDLDYLLQFLINLLNTPSPTGLADPAVELVEQALKMFPELKLHRTPKGALLAEWEGNNQGDARAVSAHVDTLGAMVKEIKASGRLKLSKIGGLQWNSVEGEGCTIFSHSGSKIRGSFMPHKASSHLYGPAIDKNERNDESMEVRLDECTTNPENTRSLGIEVGDFVAFDPRVEFNNNFVRSRHLDNKAGAACILAALKALHESGIGPSHKTFFYFSNYEEVGHGGTSGIPGEIAELLVVDMAVVGDGQNSDEFHTTLCLKDSGGPYHHGLNSKLRKLADENQIPYRVDLYPYYSSDGTSYWNAGGSAAVALIGPGIESSHHYERTHLDALDATTRLIMAFLLS